MDGGSGIGLIAALFALLVLSAYFSATETAYTSFNQVRMKTLAKSRKSAALALKLSENYDRILSTLLIGNNIVNITAASLATILFTAYFGDLGITLSTVVMTIIVLIFGEISPKSIAKERPEQFAMFSAYPLRFFMLLFTPLNLLFNAWKKLLNRIFRLHKKSPSFTEEEFKMIVTDIKNEGILNDTEHDLIQKTIQYDDTMVSSVMIPASRVVCALDTQSPQEIMKLFEGSHYSRIPYCRENLNGTVGLLYQKDFYEMLLEKRDGVRSIVKTPLYTKPNVKISLLFKQLQKAHQHMALVKNDRGEVRGIVTMEDILEELVGEIEDEYDKDRNEDAFVRALRA